MENWGEKKSGLVYFFYKRQSITISWFLAWTFGEMRLCGVRTRLFTKECQWIKPPRLGTWGIPILQKHSNGRCSHKAKHIGQRTWSSCTPCSARLREPPNTHSLPTFSTRVLSFLHHIISLAVVCLLSEFGGQIRVGDVANPPRCGHLKISRLSSEYHLKLTLSSLKNERVCVGSCHWRDIDVIAS